MQRRLFAISYLAVPNTRSVKKIRYRKRRSLLYCNYIFAPIIQGCAIIRSDRISAILHANYLPHTILDRKAERDFMTDCVLVTCGT